MPVLNLLILIITIISSINPSKQPTNSLPVPQLHQTTTPTFTMVSFTTFVLAIAAATSASAFKKPCNLPYDHCGWTLADSNYGNN